MKLIYTAITWAGRTVVGIITGLIVLVAGISLIVGITSGSPVKGLETGARAGFAIVHYVGVAAGVVLSFGDDVAPALETGRVLGDKQADTVAPAPAGAKGR